MGVQAGAIGDISQRIVGWDLIRAFAIITVFLGHVLQVQATNGAVLLAVHSLSPGLTMSLLGFLSAALLSDKEEASGAFLVRRFTRIYISLFLCLSLVLVVHAVLGKRVICAHTFLHFTGLSALLDMFGAKNQATVGAGLWFITAITGMYLLLPLLSILFRHRYGLLHLTAVILACTALDFTMHGAHSTWNVVISFCVGVYVVVTDRLEPMLKRGVAFSLGFSAGLLIACALSTRGVLPYAMRGLLFPFYPLAFVPLFFLVAKKLPTPVTRAVCLFSALSYEFYIFHFYFINEKYHELFPGSASLLVQIAIGFSVTFALAYVLSSLASRLRRAANTYFLRAEPPASSAHFPFQASSL